MEESKETKETKEVKKTTRKKLLLLRNLVKKKWK